MTSETRIDQPIATRLLIADSRAFRIMAPRGQLRLEPDPGIQHDHPNTKGVRGGGQ